MQMTPFIRQSLSRTVLKTLIKSTTAAGSLDYNKAFGNVTALFGSALGSKDDVQIPLPQSEKPRFKPEGLTDVEIEQAIVPLFDFFEANLSTLNTHLSASTKDMVMLRVWKEILNTIEGLLIPPLSDVQSDMKPLTDKEVDIVFKWLKVQLPALAMHWAARRWELIDTFSPVTVPARLLLRGRGGAHGARGAAEPQVPRHPVHPALL